VRVVGPSGTWKEVPGTLLARLEREKVKRPLFAPQKGEVMSFGDVQNGQFVQAGQELLTIRHFLTREEVIARILRRSLSLFLAPEKGNTIFSRTWTSRSRPKAARACISMMAWSCSSFRA
jgi:hypothetical protein